MADHAELAAEDRMIETAARHTRCGYRVDEADAARLPPRVTKSAKGNSPFARQGFFKWVQQVRSHRDETRAEITRRRAVKEHGVHKSRLSEKFAEPA